MWKTKKKRNEDRNIVYFLGESNLDATGNRYSAKQDYFSVSGGATYANGVSLGVNTWGRRNLHILHRLRRRLQARFLQPRPPLHNRFFYHGFVGRLYS